MKSKDELARNGREGNGRGGRGSREIDQGRMDGWWMDNWKWSNPGAGTEITRKDGESPCSFFFPEFFLNFLLLGDSNCYSARLLYLDLVYLQ